jgi:hypothetical protein
MAYGQLLKTDADFDNALFFQLRIIVWQQGEIIDYGGKIVANTEESVHINDGKILKNRLRIQGSLGGFFILKKHPKVFKLSHCLILIRAYESISLAIHFNTYSIVFDCVSYQSYTIQSYWNIFIT